MKHRHFSGTLADWRRAARAALAAGERPQDVTFVDASAEDKQQPLFGQTPQTEQTVLIRLPQAFVALAENVARHADSKRWDLLYRVAHRLRFAEPQLMADVLDPDLALLRQMERAVAREIHKCHAYVRFRQVTPAAGGKPHYVAWYAPLHDVLPLAVSFFVERFATMDWSIVTPRQAAHFVGGHLTWGPGAPRATAAGEDDVEALWHTYYANIFNPARLNLRATRSEMPTRYWANLSETALIPQLRAQAPARLQRFFAAQPARATPAEHYADLAGLAADLRGCSVCPWRHPHSPAVTGEGSPAAPLMLVGEQPGDEEDNAGRPFVGPAGKVLHRALTAAGLAREQLYLTNAVKHFKFTPRGKRRIHQSPNAADVAACRGWLGREVALVRPKVLVCLGTTAALAVRGQKTRLADVRGQLLTSAACRQLLVTYHPSAVLRAGADAQADIYAHLVADLVHARKLLAAG